MITIYVMVLRFPNVTVKFLRIDDFTGVAKMTSFYGNLSEPKTLEVVPGVDHFWFGRESELCNIIISWLDKVLQSNDQSTTPS